MRLKEYIKKWEKNKSWEKYTKFEKHKIRFEVCAKNARGKTIIDVGCAFGHSIVEMQKYKESEWFGVDFFPELYNKIQKYNPGIQVFYSPNYDMLKNVGSRFDTVICSEVLEHVEEESGYYFFRELFNLTQRKLILTTPTKTHTEKDLIDLIKIINCSKYSIQEGGPFWYVFIMR